MRSRQRRVRREIGVGIELGGGSLKSQHLTFPGVVGAAVTSKKIK